MKGLCIKKLLGMVLGALVVAACGGTGASSSGTRDCKQDSGAAKAEFPFPAVPSMLTEPEARKNYLLLHYWDRFDFADTALVNRKEVTEQGLADQLALLSKEQATDSLVIQSVDHLCSGMERDAHARTVFMQLFSDYLYQTNSPYHNEQLYGVFLERMLKSDFLTPEEKSSLRFYLDLIRRNCPGDEATSFSYRLADGAVRTLKKTPVRGDYLILVFYDPECSSCQEVLGRMMKNERLAQAAGSGKVTVLAVYTEGDEAAWRKSLQVMPREWIIGNDELEIKNGALYDIKAMPSFYLLDKKKRVLLKDASLDVILDRLGMF